MSKPTLIGWNKKRLRLWLTVFFIAMAIPAAVLVRQAYTQLKWETFHQHRVLAEELTQRINRQFIKILEKEEQRSFTDFSFLNVAGDPNANFLQRSPLSSFPVNSDIPGLIGYFQVDSAGLFSTPLLPKVINQSEKFGISSQELNQRQLLANNIQEILGKNRLVAQNKKNQTGKLVTNVGMSKDANVSLSAPMVVEERIALSDIASIASPYNSEVVETEESSVVQNESDMVHQDAVTQQSSMPRQKEKAQKMESLARADQIRQSNQLESKQLRERKKKNLQKSIVSQQAFDELNTRKNTKPNKSKRPVNRLGRVEDLKLDSRYGEFKKQDKMKLKFSQKKSRATRSKRKERSVLPEQQARLLKSPQESQKLPNKPSDIRISIFESEIDAFEFSLLDSGHFVLFRKVWRDGQRIIQGLLLEPEIFFSVVVEHNFRNTALSQMSNLAIAYHGDVYAAYSGSASSRYLSSAEELQGALLFQAPLNAPLSALELVYSVNRLPTGPGGTVIVWVSAILLSVLCGGFYLMYRLALGQINLSTQQQDFVSAVSHELKTPLTSIRMYGEMLREGWASEEKKKTYYEYIYEESERLSRLINNVLQLARMTRNDLQVELKPISVSELIDGIQSKVSSQIERAGFKLDLQCGEDIKTQIIDVDIDYFVQIIINLVDNAVKFSVAAEKRIIDISCRPCGEKNVVFGIRDYGSGVPKSQMKKIFKLFYRAENELTRETIGTGIGLALVNQLVVSMKGKVDVINHDPGAEFTISFPAYIS